MRSQFQTSATVDGFVFPQDVQTTFRLGKQNDAPVIIGSNANEGSIFTNQNTTGEQFRQQNERRYAKVIDEFMKLYPFSTDKEAAYAAAAAQRDSTFGWQMRTWARLQTETGKSKVYVYYLSRVPPLPNAEWLGAQHGSEIHRSTGRTENTARTSVDRYRSGSPRTSRHGSTLPRPAIRTEGTSTWGMQTRTDRA
jgi:carboxylesterase type B